MGWRFAADVEHHAAIGQFHDRRLVRDDPFLGVGDGDLINSIVTLLGIPTPTNQALYALVKLVESPGHG